MLAMFGGSVSNVILDYIFLFPFKMGMFGAAFATSLAPIISLGILSIHFARKQSRPAILKHKLTRPAIKDILNLGIFHFRHGSVLGGRAYDLQPVDFGA